MLVLNHIDKEIILRLGATLFTLSIINIEQFMEMVEKSERYDDMLNEMDFIFGDMEH